MCFTYRTSVRHPSQRTRLSPGATGHYPAVSRRALPSVSSAATKVVAHLHRRMAIDMTVSRRNFILHMEMLGSRVCMHVQDVLFFFDKDEVFCNNLEKIRFEKKVEVLDEDIFSCWHFIFRILSFSCAMSSYIISTKKSISVGGGIVGA